MFRFLFEIILSFEKSYLAKSNNFINNLQNSNQKTYNFFIFPPSRY